MTSPAPDVRVFTGGAFGQNGYLVSCPAGSEGILVDPGASVGEMLAAAEAAQIRIAAIVLTHTHLDHLEGVARAKRATGAPIHLHRDAEPLYRQAPVQAQLFGAQVEIPPPADEYLSERVPVSFGDCRLEVREAPGHAPGHVILVGPGLAIVGDVIFAGSIGRTDLPGGDLQLLMKSIRTQVLSLSDETVLYPGHGPATTVGHERIANPFLVPHFGGSHFA